METVFGSLWVPCLILSIIGIAFLIGELFLPGFGVSGICGVLCLIAVCVMQFMTAPPLVATLVTITELLIEAYLPSIYNALGIYIPLIVVNCIILGRAEAYANKNTPGLAVMDGIGMGLGFTVALTLAGLVRELGGAGTAFGYTVFPKEYAVGILIQPPGAFLVIALFIIIMNAIGIKTRQRELVESNGCDGCCATCAMRCEDAKEETK